MDMCMYVCMSQYICMYVNINKNTINCQKLTQKINNYFHKPTHSYFITLDLKSHKHVYIVIRIHIYINNRIITS